MFMYDQVMWKMENQGFGWWESNREWEEELDDGFINGDLGLLPRKLKKMMEGYGCRARNSK